MSHTSPQESSLSLLKAVFADNKTALIAVAVFSGIVNILMLTGSLYMMQVYDRVLNSRALPTLYGLTVLVFLLFCFMGVFEVIRQRIMVRVGEKMEANTAPKIYNLVTNLPLKSSQGGETHQPLRDFDNVKAFVGGPALMALFDLPWVPFYLLICFMFHPWVGGVTIIGLGVLLFLTFLTDKLTKTPLAKVNMLYVERMGRLENSRQKAEVIRAMGMSKPLRETWLKFNDQSLEASRFAGDRSVLMTNLSKIFRMFLQSIVLAVGAILVIKGEATGGVMIACSILTARAMAPVEQVIAQWKGFMLAKASFARLVRLMQEMPLTKSSLPMPLPKESLSVRHLSLAPPNAKSFSVQNVSFDLVAGQGLALIGPSASGKSSLAKALIGVWQPLQGEVRYDGSLINQWESEEIGQVIGYLPQDIALFQGTIAQNIARFEDNMTSEKVISAAKLANVHELILKLPQGYETLLGENGIGLSQGQGQRVALARAVYGNPFLVVLDEPNANLDADGEKALQDTLLALRATGAMVIVIAHRPSALAGLDRVAIMNNGRMVKFGTMESVFGAQQHVESGSIVAPQEAGLQVKEELK